MRQISLKNIDSLTKEELKRAIEDCFDYAPEATPVDRLAILQEAQFYTRELERRHDSWVSIRDLVLEIVVILLIGAEIYMSIRAEHLQKANFRDEKTVFEDLQRSSGATAKSLTSVKDILAEMKKSIDRQVELFYDVQINVIYNEGSKKLILLNNGRSNISIWSHRLGGNSTRMELYPKPIIVTPAGTWELGLEDTVKRLSSELPKGASQTFRFTFLVKNEKQERFTLSGDIAAAWHGDTVYFETHPQGTTPGWPK